MSNNKADHASRTPYHVSLVTYLLALADDELVLGHRDSEWTGHAPIIEEDVAFSRMAQDEMGHALTLYTVAAELVSKTPDELAFARPASEFRNCTLLELPKGDWAFTIVRQYLFDVAEQVRWQALLESSYPPVVAAAGKIQREEVYHLMHSQAWIERLGNATLESHARMQAALDIAWPHALALWEPLPDQRILVECANIVDPDTLQARWLAQVVPFLQRSGLSPAVEALADGWVSSVEAAYGGRLGRHTPFLGQLLGAMQLVYRSDPAATW